MPVFNRWLIPALRLRLRQPDMRVQRRAVAAMSAVIVLFLAGSAVYIARQPPHAMEAAALRVLAATLVLGVLLVAAAYAVRRATNPAPWGFEEAMRLLEEERRRRAKNG